MVRRVLKGKNPNYISQLYKPWKDKEICKSGDYRMDNKTLWRCKIQCQGVKPSEGAYWEKVSICDELEELRKLVEE